MKLKRIITFAFVFVLCLHFASGQNSNVYNYPVQPGTTEWANLKTQKEKVAVCQIPSAVLSNISTKDLLDVCLNYPLLPNVFMFNTFQGGFNTYKTDFNGINELLKRSDLPGVLIKKYLQLDAGNYQKDWTLIEKGKYSVDLSLIELFISQAEVVNNLTPDQKQVLTREFLNKYHQKSQTDFYGSLSYKTIAFGLARFMESDKFISNNSKSVKKDEVLQFSILGNDLTSENFENIITLSKEYLGTR